MRGENRLKGDTTRGFNREEAAFFRKGLDIAPGTSTGRKLTDEEADEVRLAFGIHLSDAPIPNTAEIAPRTRKRAAAGELQAAKARAARMRARVKR